MRRNLTIFCDESAKKGRYFSNFFGGVLLHTESIPRIESALYEKKKELNLHNEVKWERVSAQYLEKYNQFIKFYFQFIKEKHMKLRIMFTQNRYKPVGLTAEQLRMQYYILYYQMIKHAFGLRYSDPRRLYQTTLSIKLDQIPDSNESFRDFRRFLSSIPRHRDLRDVSILIPEENIMGIDSKDHTILQGFDIILGSMNFRLNDLHKAKPSGARRRGKRTIAKEKLYRVINQEIQSLFPWLFNIGMNTGTPNGCVDRWHHPYRHWNFVPRNHVVDHESSKPRQ